MKIGIQTWGTQGDIFPFFALAEGLTEAGHEVSLAYTSIENKDFSSHANGFSTNRVHGDFDDVESLYPNAMKRSGTFRQLAYLMGRAFDPAVDSMYEASKKLCAENDVVIGHSSCHMLATAAEKYNRRRASVFFASSAVKSKGASVMGNNLGRTLNSISWTLSDYVLKQTLFRKCEQLRETEGLPPSKSILGTRAISEDLTLIAASPALTKRYNDWGGNIQICGFWNSKIGNLSWEISKSLKQFLDSGEAPIYMTFGSLNGLVARESVELLVRAAQKSNRRAIIQTTLH